MPGAPSSFLLLKNLATGSKAPCYNNCFFHPTIHTDRAEMRKGSNKVQVQGVGVSHTAGFVWLVHPADPAEANCLAPDVANAKQASCQEQRTLRAREQHGMHGARRRQFLDVVETPRVE